MSSVASISIVDYRELTDIGSRTRCPDRYGGSCVNVYKPCWQIAFYKSISAGKGESGGRWQAGHNLSGCLCSDLYQQEPHHVNKLTARAQCLAGKGDHQIRQRMCRHSSQGKDIFERDCLTCSLICLASSWRAKMRSSDDLLSWQETCKSPHFSPTWSSLAYYQQSRDVTG